MGKKSKTTQYLLEQEFDSFCQNPKVNKYKGKTYKTTSSDSASSYAYDYLPKLPNFLCKSYPFEKDFLDVIPYLLSLGKYEECTQVLLRVYRAVQIEAYSGRKTLKNCRAAFNKYALFIQHNYIDQRKKVILPSSFTSPYLLHDIIDELNNGIVYYYVKHGDIIRANGLKLSINNKSKYNLWKIMDNRLRSQNRTSGNKPWLSLDLIKAIDPDALKYYVDTINENTIIHANNNGNRIAIKCSDIWCIYMYKTSGHTKYNITVTNKKFDTYDVQTPTALLGKRIPMLVDGINKIVIDHVKPIDQSLKDLASNGTIPELVSLSDAYKNAKKYLLKIKNGTELKDTEIVKLAKKGLNVNKKILINEMGLLLKDSWYRLMDSDENAAKSNDFLFYEFRTNNVSNPTEIIGLITTAQLPTNNTNMIVYQDLNNPGMNYVNSDYIVKSTYNTPINLTDFFSSLGPDIL